jgi:hypothetical protein
MYRLAGKMTPAEHLAAGRFKVKTGTAPRNEHAYAQAKFTPKGVEDCRPVGQAQGAAGAGRQRQHMSLSASLTNAGHPVAYYPRLARFFGSVNVAILFAQLHYWSQRGESDLGTHKSSEQFTEETGLSYREQVTARKQLREAGFLIETHRRLEHRVYYRLNLEAVDAAFDAWTEAQTKRNPRTTKTQFGKTQIRSPG